MPLGPWSPSQTRGPMKGSGPALPGNTLAPVASGTVTIGGTLSVTNGTWSSVATPTFTYQWQRDGVNIAAATASTYTPVAADVTPTTSGQLVGPAITCLVTATNSVGSTPATSNTLTYSVTGSLGSALRLWLRGDLGVTTSSGKVTTWADQSGLANDFSQSTDGNRPTTTTVNSLAAINNAASKWLTGPTFQTMLGYANGAITIVGVWNASSLSGATADGAPGILSDLVSVTYHSINSTAVNSSIYATGTVQKKAASATSPSTGVTYRSISTYDNATAITAKLGSGAAGTTASGAMLAGALNHSTVVGLSSNGLNSFVGAICELFLITSASASQLADLDAWVLRYGATT